MPGNKYFSSFGQLWVIQSPLAKTQNHPENSRQFETTWKFGNHLENPDSLEIIRKIGNHPEKSGQLSRFSFCTRKNFPDAQKLSGIFHLCNDDAEDDDDDDDDGDDDDAHSEVITGQFSRSQCWKSTQCTTGSTCFLSFRSNPFCNLEINLMTLQVFFLHSQSYHQINVLSRYLLIFHYQSINQWIN